MAKLDPASAALPHPKPTAQVEPYFEALGLEDTLKFLETFGGNEIYIASHPSYRSRVAACIGYPKARMLSEISARLQRRVPLAKKWRAQVYRSQGLKISQIATRLGVTDVMVRIYLRDMPKPPDDPNQMALF